MADKSENAKPAVTAKKPKVDGLTEVMDNISAMPERDREMAMHFHSIVERVAPSLKPRLWYGMPAYTREGKVLCFYQSASKFKARYATFGFEEQAALDEGAMWPTSYALTDIGAEEESRIEALILKAMG